MELKKMPDYQDVLNAFQAVRNFTLPAHDNFKDGIVNAAINDANSNQPVLLDDELLTAGMRIYCLNPVLNIIDEFNRLCGVFDALFARHLNAHLNAGNELQNNIQIRTDELNITEERIIAIHDANPQYRQARENKVRLNNEYDEMYRGENQRPAKNFHPMLYFFILFIIGSIEWLINYSSFLEFYNVPAMAAGFTLAVSLAVACASHWHGTRLKAIHYFFGEHVALEERKKEIIAISIVTIALVAAICYVGWVRYSWAIDLVGKLGIDSSISIEKDNNLPIINVGQKVVVSLIANLLVWFIGAVLAYAVHDKNPAFTEKLRELNAAEKLYDSLHANPRREIERERARLLDEINRLNNIARARIRDFGPLEGLQIEKDQLYGRTLGDANNLMNALVRSYRQTLHETAININNITLQFTNNINTWNLEDYLLTPINDEYNDIN